MDTSITYKTKSKSLKIDETLFKKMKDAVLGKKYELSVVFIGPKEMQKINLSYRNKDYATDILSFPLSETSGEIFICKQKADQKSKEYDREKNNFLYFLFIHGLVHLKGFEHGSRMDIEEEKFRKKFGI
ncbi:MAG: rRNA maturation RNase YbeY [Patescibacteria group bacterium]